MAHVVRFRRNSQTEFAKAFRPLSERHKPWQVWADFVNAAAIAMAAQFDPPDTEKYKEREREYFRIMKQYDEKERMVFPQLLLMMMQALEEEPEQDFLGEMFMMLELSNHWKGQFFTPYDVCRMMAEMTMQDAAAHIERKGWVGIYDPACGAGATLIAARNYLQRNPCGKLLGHQQTLFVAQDIDRTAALMCYLQLSMLGCAGYVIVGNTITNPGVGLGGSPLLPLEKEGQDYWCMPLFHDQIWVWRQAFARLEFLTGSAAALPISDPPTEKPAAQSVTEDATATLEQAGDPEPVKLNATATGQLTLF